jgi:exopolysaccharide production protein ExoY
VDSPQHEARAIPAHQRIGKAIAIDEQAATLRLRSLPSPPSVDARGLYCVAGKRLLDLVLVLLLSPFWVSVYLIVALLVLVFDGRPIHHRSVRVGKDDERIRILKFRTMSLNADQELARLLAADPALGQEYRARVKLHSDPRVTKLGRILRCSSLDELPQLVNVLLGDMSLVGPRPLLECEVDDLYASGAADILGCRPGLTGLWQVSGRSLLPYEQRFVLGSQYVQAFSLWIDIKILLRTVPGVFARRGAF